MSRITLPCGHDEKYLERRTYIRDVADVMWCGECEEEATTMWWKEKYDQSQAELAQARERIAELEAEMEEKVLIRSTFIYETQKEQRIAELEKALRGLVEAVSQPLWKGSERYCCPACKEYTIYGGHLHKDSCAVLPARTVLGEVGE
jgi:hypothetical protein